MAAVPYWTQSLFPITSLQTDISIYETSPHGLLLGSEPKPSNLCHEISGLFPIYRTKNVYTTPKILAKEMDYLYCVVKNYSKWMIKETTLCILRNKYGFQIANAMEKINSILTRK